MTAYPNIRSLKSGAEHSIYDMKFRRKFSVNPYRTLRLPLGEMSFHKDWIRTDRGDPYPVTDSMGDGMLAERTADGRLSVWNPTDAHAAKARLLGQHFPYATYEIKIDTLERASVGFAFRAAAGDGSSYTKENEPYLRIWLAREGDFVRIYHQLVVGGVSTGVKRDRENYPYVPGMSLLVSCRRENFDISLRTDKKKQHRLTLTFPAFSTISRHSTFVNATASLWYDIQPQGSLTADAVEFYLDGGVSHADMKPIRYEDGTPILADGRVFMTMSSRMEAGGFQSVISWNPSTSDMRMEGAIFFDCGDDVWCSDVASSILFNRMTNEWYIWACSFSHGHILCHGTSIADLRYGINVIDATLMEVEQTAGDSHDSLGADSGGTAAQNAALSDDRLWMAKSGDEDPDLVYDPVRKKWYMTICRPVSENGKNYYRYFLFESDSPFSGFTYRDHTLTGANTGGSIVRVGGKYYFVCGSNFHVRAQYNIYDLEDFSKFQPVRCDYDDGGFRGWGTIIPIPCGNRTKYMWMTFDRHGGSTYNWSYGNLYVYESDLMNSGYEGPIQYNL